MTTGDIVWPHKHGSAAHVQALQKEVERLTTLHASEYQARRAADDEVEKLRMQASRRETEIRGLREMLTVGAIYDDPTTPR